MMLRRISSYRPCWENTSGIDVHVRMLVKIAVFTVTAAFSSLTFALNMRQYVGLIFLYLIKTE